LFCRAILKSGNSLVNFFEDLFDTQSFSVFQEFLTFADHLQGSKIIGAMNIFASIGDVALALDDSESDLTQAFALDAFEKLSARGPDGIVSIADNILSFTPESIGLSRVAKGRVDGRRVDGKLSDKGKRSVISTGLLPSLYIFPESVKKAGESLGRERQMQAFQDKFALHKNENQLRAMIANKSRFTQDEVANVERHLDSEYMPFYFHDLRTNEIIAFHAFLKGLSDSYSPRWEETQAYGRIDSVMTYSSTTRSINVQFVVAAMSTDDFSEMWWKINKLLTLVYPQWSEGRAVQSEGQQFVQPFSQIPTASPLIRLRLGDLFRSNYSKFALARLFGLGTDKFNVANREDELFASDGDVTSNTTSPRPQPRSDVIEPGDRVAVTTRTTTVSAPRSSGIVISVSPQPTDPSKNNYVVEIARGERITLQQDQIGLLRKANEECRVNRVKHSKQAVAQKAAENFFKLDNNAIFRAFDSVKGKGLAGVITGLSFDWFDANWEIDKDLGKAPQWCTITLDFQPIHDIAPGLDSAGFNRAPVYNVGAHVKGLVGDE